MFRRMLMEDWQRTASMVGTALFALVFVSGVVRAFCMSRERVRRMESLPLEEESHE